MKIKFKLPKQKRCGTRMQPAYRTRRAVQLEQRKELVNREIQRTTPAEIWL